MASEEIAEQLKAVLDECRCIFLKTCEVLNVPAALERSRSGNGGHIWIFFNSPIEAVLARELGSTILTYTMETHPHLGIDSYGECTWTSES